MSPFFHSVTTFFKRDIFHRVNHFFTVWLIFLHVTHVLQCDLFTEWPIFHSVTYFLQSDSCFVAYSYSKVRHNFQNVTFPNLTHFFYSVTYFFKCDPFFIVRQLYIRSIANFYRATHFWNVSHILQCDTFSKVTHFSQCDSFFQMWPIF